MTGTGVSRSTKTIDMKNRLTVLWTTADPVTVEKMVFMYTLNAKLQGWFEEVTLVVWGASTRLLAENSHLQERVGEMVAAGIRVEACKACSDSYGVSDQLSALGVDVKYMGTPLTEMLQGDWKVLTF